MKRSLCYLKNVNDIQVSLRSKFGSFLPTKPNILLFPDINPWHGQYAHDIHVLHRVIFTDTDEKIVNKLY